MKKVLLMACLGITLFSYSNQANADIIIDLENAATSQAMWMDKHGYNEQVADSFIRNCTSLNYYCPGRYVWCTSMSLERRWIVNIRESVSKTLWNAWVKTADVCDR